MLQNKAYDILKWVCIIVLPACASLYAELGEVWGFPFLNEIPKSIIIVDAFLGALLCVSTIKYNKDNVRRLTEEGEEDNE